MNSFHNSVVDERESVPSIVRSYDEMNAPSYSGHIARSKRGRGFRTSRREFSTAGFLKRSFVSRISGPISRSIEPHDRSAQSARERTSSSIIIRTINESSLEMLRNEVILLRTLLLRRSSLLKLPCYYRSWILRSTRREGQENENLPNDFQPDPIYTPSNLDFDQEYTLIPTP